MRYFFDFFQGNEVTPDEEGAEFPSLALVKKEAARLLEEVANLMLRVDGTEARGISLRVRDEGGRTIFEFCQGDSPQPPH